MRIRELKPPDIPWVERMVEEYFGSPRIVSKGVLHEARQWPCLIAEEGSKPVGMLQYSGHDDQCEIVVLISGILRQGICRALLEEAWGRTRPLKPEIPAFDPQGRATEDEVEFESRT